MKCSICQNGTTTDGHTTIVLEREQTTVVFKKVPAQICDNCGEEYVSAEVNEALLSQAHAEWERGIIRFLIEGYPSGQTPPALGQAQGGRNRAYP